MTRREKRRRMRRMLAGLFAAAAVLVPTAPAAIVHDDPADRVAQAAIIVPDTPSDRAASSNQGLSVGEQLALIRGDVPDGKVSTIELRRDGNAAVSQEPKTTSAPQSSSGSAFDWTASGIGAGFAALVLLLALAGFRLVSRHGMAHA